ncbi:hypothetical protein [Mucilaginibacter gossypiicola]|nr:hypothetical protein [Mucilaginibacter gossypiicola]
MKTNLNPEGLEPSIEQNVVNAEAITYDSLTVLQKQRVDYLKPMIGDHAIKVVYNLDKRGPNSWIVVYEKVAKIHKATYDEQRYQDAVIENIEVGNEYLHADLIGIFSQVRGDLKLQPYLTNLKRNCENDLYGLFLVKETYSIETIDGKEKKTAIGYKIIACLKPDSE